MESKSIESLPEEIMLKVFEMLDVNSTLNSFLVCKRWNDVISNSTAASKAMKLVVKPDHSAEQVNNLQRKFSYIQLFKFRDESGGNFETADLSRKLSFKQLEIFKLSMKVENVMKVLAPLENLESVVIGGSYLTGKVEALPGLKKIKKVTLTMSSSKLLKLFSASQVVSLDVVSQLYGKTDSLAPFLASQTKLESLSISLSYLDLNRLFSGDFSSKLVNASFKLKHLSVFLYGGEHKLQGFAESSFNEFLIQHASHLESLVLKGKFSPDVYKTVFTKFKSLKRLSIDFIPKHRNFCEQLILLKASRQLIMFNEMPGDEVLTRLITIVYRYNPHRLRSVPTIFETFCQLKLNE